MNIYCFSAFGYEGELVKVEVDLRRGIPAIDIIGLPDSAVREARDRMQTAIRNAGIAFPRERILINLSPADVRKEGSSFDLAIALAVLNADAALFCQGGTGAGKHGELMVLGELELSGKVRPVRGVLAAVSLGLKYGITGFLVPAENLREAQIAGKEMAAGAESLADAVAIAQDFYRNGFIKSETYETSAMTAGIWDAAGSGDFSEVRGQPELLRAMTVAAAGGHNMFVFGAPGCGKSMALRRFCELLPGLDFEDAVTVTKLKSLSEPMIHTGLCSRPPFRMPHHSISIEGLTGGGKHIRPGEVSLAHKGVLFIDEAPSFPYAVLQSLRSPLENGSIVISRAGRTAQFPTDFQLLMAANPCPCGNLGAKGKICVCDPGAIERYWKKFSAPLLDRIEIRVPVSVPDGALLIAKNNTATESAETRRDAISGAQLRQKERFGGTLRNRHMTPAMISQWCALDAACSAFFSEVMAELQLSARAGHGILKTARTIADLADSGNIATRHLEEAVGLRRWGDSPWNQPAFEGLR